MAPALSHPAAPAASAASRSSVKAGTSGRYAKLRFALGLLADEASVIEAVAALKGVGIEPANLGILTGMSCAGPSPTDASGTKRPSQRRTSRQGKDDADRLLRMCDGVGHRIVCTCCANNPHFTSLDCNTASRNARRDTKHATSDGGIDHSLTDYLCRWAAQTLANKRHCDRVVRHLGSGAPALIAIFRDHTEQQIVCETLLSLAPHGVETHELSLTQPS